MMAGLRLAPTRRRWLPLLCLLVAATVAIGVVAQPITDASLTTAASEPGLPSLPVGGLSAEDRSLVELRAQFRARFGTRAAATATGGQSINIAVHAEITDPITKLLHSQWIWVIFALVILIIVCIIAYCFRDQVAVCVGHCETCMYHTIKFLLLPFRALRACVQTCFYPVKQCTLATKDRCTRYFRPSQTRVAGLRY